MSTERLSQIALYLEDIVQSISTLAEAMDAIAKEYSPTYKAQIEAQEQVNLEKCMTSQDISA